MQTISDCEPDLFGLPPAQDVSANIKLLREGIPVEAVQGLRAVLDLNEHEIADVTNIPRRTLARRKKQGKFLYEESEKLLRILRVVQRAVQLFEGDQEAARRWLNTPDAVLDGETPLVFAETGPGAEFVLTYIGRLEFGIPS